LPSRTSRPGWCSISAPTQRLQLALGRVKRDIDAAPAGAKTALAKRREELHRAYDQAMDRALELDRLPAE